MRAVALNPTVPIGSEDASAAAHGSAASSDSAECDHVAARSNMSPGRASKEVVLLWPVDATVDSSVGPSTLIAAAELGAERAIERVLDAGGLEMDSAGLGADASAQAVFRRIRRRVEVQHDADETLRVPPAKVWPQWASHTLESASFWSAIRDAEVEELDTVRACSCRSYNPSAASRNVLRELFASMLPHHLQAERVGLEGHQKRLVTKHAHRGAAPSFVWHDDEGYFTFDDSEEDDEESSVETPASVREKRRALRDRRARSVGAPLSAWGAATGNTPISLISLWPDVLVASAAWVPESAKGAHHDSVEHIDNVTIDADEGDCRCSFVAFRLPGGDGPGVAARREGSAPSVEAGFRVVREGELKEFHSTLRALGYGPRAAATPLLVGLRCCHRAQGWLFVPRGEVVARGTRCGAPHGGARAGAGAIAIAVADEWGAEEAAAAAADQTATGGGSSGGGAAPRLQSALPEWPLDSLALRRARLEAPALPAALLLRASITSNNSSAGREKLRVTIEGRGMLGAELRTVLLQAESAESSTSSRTS
jgi:hypothetical protein